MTDKPPEPVIAIPLKEWERMNRRIGFLEGVWIGLKRDADPTELVAAIDARYAEICGEVAP